MLVYNIRPQAMARLKLGYEDVRKVNPKIIYVGCFGFSQRGPYAAKAAYDDMIQGASGMPWLLQKQGAAEPRYAPMIVADRSVGQQVASAVSAALYYREKTGKGQRVDVPMFEHLLQMVLGDHLGGYTFEPPDGEPGYAASSRRTAGPTRRRTATSARSSTTTSSGRRSSTSSAGRRCFPTRGSPRQEVRSKNYDTAYALVAEELKKRTTAEWIEALERADIPVQRMNSLDDIVADPHLAAIGYLQRVEHPTEGRIKTLAVPSEWSESPPEYRRHAPRLGEHTREVLSEAGFSERSKSSAPSIARRRRSQ